MLLKNPALESPNISPSAYVSESAVITGNVIIGERAFLALHSSIRADEPGSQVIIGNGCNIQDNVIIHTLTNTKAVIGDYSSPLMAALCTDRSRLERTVLSALAL
ncbi:MAG: hypothetical protein O8C58_02485 [Candidatus Methanoperedens sp.]|nr:hypothetical protein [Candidatus Methanoperedens sp.]